MTLYNQIDSNKRKTWVIMFLFIAVVVLVSFIFGQYFSYDSGLSAELSLILSAYALIFSGITSFGSYYFSDKIVLAISGAKPVAENDNPQLYRLVENLCIGAGLPKPKIYLINDSAPNAFATGRDPKHAVICVTTGLLEKLNRLELEGVIAHELSHIGNYDTRLLSIVSILVGSITLLADWFLRSMFWGGHRRRDRDSGNSNGFILIIALIFAIISPIIATLIHLAISRNREYLADASGSLLTRYPNGLASALEKIAKDKEPLEAANKGTAHLYIINPLKNDETTGFLAGLFNTHPPVGERIKRLRAM